MNMDLAPNATEERVAMRIGTNEDTFSESGTSKDEPLPLENARITPHPMTRTMPNPSVRVMTSLRRTYARIAQKIELKTNKVETTPWLTPE